MVSFEVSDIKEFKNIIEVTERYVPELRFDCSPEGISFTALNKGHIVFIGCNIMYNWFTTYTCDEETSFMVDTFELKNALNRIKGDGRLTCTLNTSDFEIEYTNNDGSGKRFRIGLISELYESPTPPNIPYPASTTVEFSQLKEYCSDSMLYSDKVAFHFEEEALFIGSSNDYTKYQAKLTLLDELPEEFNVIISGEYLESFFKLGLGDLVVLKVGSDMPFYATVTSDDECLSYSVLIAPRLEEDE